MSTSEFYIELGRLLYAVAKSDGQVQKEEKEKIYSIVKDELLSLEDTVDEFGMDNAFYTEFEFERLVDIRSGAKDPFQSFVSYVKMNHEEIHDELKKLVIRCVEKVAFAYGGIDETEQALIDKLAGKLKD
jgi:uncharacterized tellurite resistance protein B-like protein